MFTLLVLSLVPYDKYNVSAAFLILASRIERILRRRLKLRRRSYFTFELCDGFDLMQSSFS